jgi:Zn-dependent membrane protease YugP
MFFDLNYLLFVAIPAALFGMWAQVRLTSAYNKYRQVRLYSNVTGAEAAREILDRAGLHNVSVEEIGGHLTDHYDPRHRRLCLSSENYRSNSIAAVGVAAHEAGHALQHQAAYAPLHLRMSLVSVTQFASFAWSGIILIGILMGISKLLWVGVAVLAIMSFFHLVTLPVEFDASRRAKVRLQELGLVRPEEAAGVNRVLGAAAMTYVAALVSSVLTLLYYLMLARSSNRN